MVYRKIFAAWEFTNDVVTRAGVSPRLVWGDGQRCGVSDALTGLMVTISVAWKGHCNPVQADTFIVKPGHVYLK